MRIREDYIGNTTGKIVHGIKRAHNHNRAHKSYCGLMPGHWIPKMEMDEMIQQITCKRCRQILDLSDELSEKSDYFLVIDTCVCSLPSTVAACETISEVIKHIKGVIDDEDIDLDICNLDRFKIVGVKEVENILISLVSKGYDIVLTKQ